MLKTANCLWIKKFVHSTIGEMGYKISCQNCGIKIFSMQKAGLLWHKLYMHGKECFSIVNIQFLIVFITRIYWIELGEQDER